MQHASISANLRVLSTMFPSVAEICRRLKVNRQQFNKYLSGQTRPSPHNMRKICKFFGITESEIYLESSRFAEVFALKKSPPSILASGYSLSTIESLYKCSGNLDRYIGYYFRYHYSFSHPGFLIKSMARISAKNGQYFCSTAERITLQGAKRNPVFTNYKGAMFFLTDRIFVVEYQSILQNSITEMILYPSYHRRISFIVGIQTGAASIRGRKPAASRVLLEYIGKDINVKAALRSIGLFHETSGVIDPKIRELVRNRIPKGSYVLEVNEV